MYDAYGELEIADEFDGFGDFGELELAVDGFGALEYDDDDDMDGFGDGGLMVAEDIEGFGEGGLMVAEDIDGLGELELAIDGYGQPGWRRRRRRWQRRRPWRRGRGRGQRGGGGGRHRQRWGRRGSAKRLKKRSKFYRRRAMRLRKRAEKAEERGDTEKASWLREKASRVAGRRKKMLERSSQREGRRGRAAKHITEAGERWQEARRQREAVEEVAEEMDGFGALRYDDDEYDGYWEDVQGMIPAKGPMRTGVFAVAGAGLAHVLTKGSKKKKGQAALFGAGAGALLALFMGGKPA